ncbi:MAG: glycosyltransferase family 4 protein [Patescibacteria group bacterium]
MRVLHIACVAPPEIGGIGQVALREVTGLRAHGVDARLVAPELPPGHHAEKALADYDRSFVHRLPSALRWGNASLLEGWWELAKSADVIHLHYPYYGFTEQLLFANVALPPIVITYHMDAMAKKTTKGWVFALHRFFLQNRILRMAKKILVSSFDYARNASVSSFFRRDPDRFIELPFGIDTARFSPGLDERERLMIGEQDPTILFVGGLDEAHAFKGLSVLFEAFAKLDHAAHLVIVGDGDKRAEFEEEAREKGIVTRVHFMGRVSAEELVPLYRSADVFAFPSTSQAEAFGLVALEAQACGLPVVASDLPGVRTVVRNDETGLLVPPNNADALADALADLLAHPQKRAMFAAAARVHAEKYGYEAHTAALMNLYREICE